MTKVFLNKNIYLILILFIAAFLRFWQLGLNPPSLFVDEVSNGYNAYSILKTGRDEYGNLFPTTFRAFGDYNPALSVYLLIPSIIVFGLNDFSIRFPSAFLGTLTVFLTYLLVLKIFRNKKAALAASFLLAISPWHLQFSRYDHEANFMLFFSILGLTFFLISKNSTWPKNYFLLIVSAIAFGLALNTYHGAKIWIPLFLLNIFFWYRKSILKFGRKVFLILLILTIFTLPIIFNINHSLIRAQSVGLFGRSQNSLETFMGGYLSHFSPNFLFTSGDSIGRHSVSGMGQLYVFEIPLIILGLISLIRLKSTESKFLLCWLLLAPIPAALATPTPHALRALTFLPLWSIISALGLKTLAKFSSKSKLKIIIILAIFTIGIYNFITYLHLYYKHYPKLNAPDWADGYKEMILFVNQLKDKYDKVAISNYYGRPYIYVLFYSKYDPSLYQSQSQDKNKFDKYEFFGESWKKDTQGKVIVVRPKWQIPVPPPKYLKFIYSENGDLVFRISEE